MFHFVPEVMSIKDMDHTKGYRPADVLPRSTSMHTPRIASYTYATCIQWTKDKITNVSEKLQGREEEYTYSYTENNYSIKQWRADQNSFEWLI